MDYDDGYVVYINNVEVARINMIGSPTHSSSANYWHEALMYLGYAPKTITLDPALMETLLVDGTNVIAVEIHQYFGGDDATGRTWLHFGMSTPDVYFLIILTGLAIPERPLNYIQILKYPITNIFIYIILRVQLLIVSTPIICR